MMRKGSEERTLLGKWMDSILLTVAIFIVSLLWFLPKVGGIWASLAISIAFTAAVRLAISLGVRMRSRRDELKLRKEKYARYWLEGLVWVPEAAALESCVAYLEARCEVRDREAVPGGMIARVDGRRAYLGVVQALEIAPPDARDVIAHCRRARTNDAQCMILFGTVGFSGGARDAAREMGIDVELIGPRRLSSWMEDAVRVPEREPRVTGWVRMRRMALSPERRSRYLISCFFLILLYLITSAWYLLPPALISLALAKLAREPDTPVWP